jgi:hypothetical protein
MIVAAAIGGVCGAIAVAAHGIVGHRWLTMQLRDARLVPSLWGDADMARRVLFVTWHFVTVLFAATTAALTATALGRLHDPTLLRAIALVHAALVIVALLIVNRRIAAVLRPFAILALAAIAGAGVSAWIAADALSLTT